jgi:mannose/cellobiose epimerase-like protein (N-acyl-D-glucosamine 2-epimerase family)
VTAAVNLEREGERLLAFARGSVHPDGGFGWLSEDGRLEPQRPVELWITCRMTHVFALAHLQGHAWAAELVDHGVAALTGRFHDAVHGGWYAAVDAAGPVTRSKTAYEHAFVVLAASSAAAAGRPRADALLAAAMDVFDRRFWDDDAGMVVEEWDESWSVLDGYRGGNANMHAVEALLAVGDTARASRIVRRVVHDLARSNHWRIPEHFDSAWRPVPDYHRDQPAHPFRPYGATIGHWFEWSRLALALRAGLGEEAPEWLLPDAVALFDAGVREGWAVDGSEGFVYTVDWDGAPVVRQRMHWVVAEAIAAAATLHAETGDAAYAICEQHWWGYVDRWLVDRAGGSWHHELGPDNRPAAGTWSGKPDVYHAYQATLMRRLPVWPPFAQALARHSA